MTPPDGARQHRVLDALEDVKRVYELVAWAIGAVAAIVGFIEAQGGLVQVLVQIGILGFACYISLFVAVPVALGMLRALELSAKRTSTDVSVAAITVVVAVILALLIRFHVFYDGIGSEGDLDAVGTAFTAAVGAIVLAVPFVVLWWRKGSSPA